MSHAYARNYIHIVFSTQERRQFIRDLEGMWTYLRGIANEYGVELAEVGGTNDHVHILAVMPPKISLAVLMRALKGNSSKWMNEAGHLFAWQQGYGAFSVSASNLEKVREFVRKQAEHHQRVTYEAEFMALLRKHGIPFTPGHILG